MSKSNGKLGSIVGTSTLARARFGPGMLLQHEDLEQLSSYTRDLSRLLFKSLFGCGVICGLRVTATPHCGLVKVTVGAGVALACSGDPIYVPTDQSFPLDENCEPLIDKPLWIVLCGTVKCCAPRTAICSDEDEAHSECTRERDGFEIRVVRELPKCVCHCPEPKGDEKEGKKTDCQCVDPKLPCYEDHYQGKCGCNCGGCTDCDCKCILLARLDWDKDKKEWKVDYRVRRFIRPVLMRDPPLEPEEEDHAQEPTKETSPTEAEVKQLIEDRKKLAEENEKLWERIKRLEAQQHAEQPKPPKNGLKKGH